MCSCKHANPIQTPGLQCSPFHRSHRGCLPGACQTARPLAPSPLLLRAAWTRGQPDSSGAHHESSCRLGCLHTAHHCDHRMCLRVWRDRASGQVSPCVSPPQARTHSRACCNPPSQGAHLMTPKLNSRGESATAIVLVAAAARRQGRCCSRALRADAAVCLFNQEARGASAERSGMQCVLLSVGLCCSV